MLTVAELGPLALSETTSELAARQQEASPTAADVMGAPGVSVAPEGNVIEVAARMTAYRLYNVPVVDGDRLVGIVTRGDVIRGFESNRQAMTAEVRRRVADYDDGNGFRVSAASGGPVTIIGCFDDTDGQVIAALAKEVPGVTEVRLRPRPADKGA